MAEANDFQNLPIGETTGLSSALLRRAALMLLLFSAPAFLITLQMRRNDLKRAEYSQLQQQNLSMLKGLASRSDSDCMRLQNGVPAPVLSATEEARLNPAQPAGDSNGLAVLLSSAGELAAVNESVNPVLRPCGGA